MSFTASEKLSLENILKINLSVKNNEKIFVLVNDPEDFKGQEKEKAKELLEIGKELVNIGREFTNIDLIVSGTSGNHGMEPLLPVWESVFGESLDILKEKRLIEKLLDKQLSENEKNEVVSLLNNNNFKVDAIIALTYYSTSHTFFRKLLTDKFGCRYASMPLFEKSMLTGSMNVDYSLIKERSEKIRELVNGAISVKITAKNGSEINLNVKEREFIADTGLLIGEGDFGNLPAGEVFIAPVEGKANGVFVIEYGPDDGKLDNPFTAVIDNGEVVELKGKGRWVDFLNNKFNEDRSCRNVAELGIGTNEGATNVANILETEKILGTIHIAFGDNSSFGGKVQAPFHLDFVLFKPTVLIEKDAKESVFLLKDGKLLI